MLSFPNGWLNVFDPGRADAFATADEIRPPGDFGAKCRSARDKADRASCSCAATKEPELCNYLRILGKKNDLPLPIDTEIS